MHNFTRSRVTAVEQIKLKGFSYQFTSLQEANQTKIADPTRWWYLLVGFALQFDTLCCSRSSLLKLINFLWSFWNI